MADGTMNGGNEILPPQDLISSAGQPARYIDPGVKQTSRRGVWPKKFTEGTAFRWDVMGFLSRRVCFSFIIIVVVIVIIVIIIIIFIIIQQKSHHQLGSSPIYRSVAMVAIRYSTLTFKICHRPQPTTQITFHHSTPNE